VPTGDDYIYHSFEIQIYEAGEGIHRTGAVYDAQAPSRMLPSQSENGTISELLLLEGG